MNETKSCNIKERRNPKRKINAILICYTLIFSFMLTVSGLLITSIQNYKTNLIKNIEEQKREDARILLRDAVNRFDRAIVLGQVDSNNIDSVAKWSYNNFSGLRNGSATSDGFIIELGSEQFVDDQSLDCQKPEFKSNGRYMKDEAAMHKDPKLAELILNKMRIGVSTKHNDNYYWNFDGSPEWLEWTIYPPNITIGLNDEPKTIRGIKNPNYKRYLFVLGTQQDEILKQYQNTFNMIDNITKLIYLLLFTSLVSLTIKMFYLVYIELHYKPNNCF